MQAVIIVCFVVFDTISIYSFLAQFTHFDYK